MRYVVNVQGSRVAVELDEGGARVDGVDVPAHIADVEGTPVQLVTLGDSVHRVVAQRLEGRGNYILWVDGWRFAVEALDERTRAIRDMAGTAAAALGPSPLIAPMPGLIVRVLVAADADVQAGESLVVMEAMKMENELRATSAGRVAAIRVKPGDTVEKGAVLVELG